jgi:hypothetical protein
LNDIDVFFEFVFVLKKKVEQKIYKVETFCGASTNFKKNKSKIIGVSPLGLSDISEGDIRKKE